MHLPEVHDPNPRETERRSSQQQDDKVSAEVLGLCTFEIDHSRHPTDHVHQTHGSVQESKQLVKKRQL
jgi:hypothetical protein